MDNLSETDADLINENIILARGDDYHKLSIIQNLPQLLQSEPQETYSTIIPKILEELPNASCEFQVVTSKAFKIFMEKQVPENLFQAVLQGIESNDVVVADSWTETLIAIIPVLNESQIKHDVLPLVNAKSQLSHPLWSRLAACKMLGKIALHACFDATDVKREIVPLLQSLCQDCHPEVRSVICTQFPYIAQGLGSGLMKGDLLACLVELGSDDNTYVRSASVSAIVQIFPFTSLDVKKATLFPLIKQLCSKSLKNDDLTIATIAKEIGRIVDGLQCALTTPECLWFLNFYKRLAMKGLYDDNQLMDGSMDVTCRQNAALNLPAMSVFVNEAIPFQRHGLHLVLQGLAADPSVTVRKTVAGCFYEVVKIFDSLSRTFKSSFVHLLQDDSDEVLHSLVPHLGVTFELFCKSDASKRDSDKPLIDQALIKRQHELASGNNWRLSVLFMQQLEHLPRCLSSDYIHENFTPILLSCAVEARARPVRIQAVRTLLIFLRYTKKETQRQWLRENLVKQLSRSDSYYTRLVYVRLCAAAIDIFSDRYFKRYFFNHLLDMAADPVANIRLCVVNLFTSLKRMLSLPEDQPLDERFNNVLERYKKEEKDRDVIEAFQFKVKEMSNIDVGEEYRKEQKRRQDGEDQVIRRGLPQAPDKVPVSRFSKVGPNTVKEHLTPSPKINGLRSTNLPIKQVIPSLSNQISDMSILEQHFYIDAGINLPAKALDNSNNKLCAQPKASTLGGNITDDDKVNLRKLHVTEKPTKKVNKRYSSVLSETCLLKHEQKVANRRSLNLSSTTISRIPVSKAKSKSEKVEVDEPVVSAARTSHLPVLVRQTTNKK